MHRCTYFNSRLRKSASLEDTFFTKWCSRLSAVLILTNDSFQNIGFGLVCVTPTAQNGGFMLFSMFVFMVILFLFAPRLNVVLIFATHAFIQDDPQVLVPTWELWGLSWLQLGRTRGYFGSKLGGLGVILSPAWGSWIFLAPSSSSSSASASVSGSALA